MKTFIQFLTEQKKRTYGCVMLAASVPRWSRDHLSLIDKDDIFVEEGLEKDPHVTIAFGIHEDTANPQAVLRMIQDTGPITVTVDKISLFENDKFDVVKYDIPKDRALTSLRKSILDAFENTQTYPDYHPHMTIGYVLPGTGKQYAGKVTPFEVTFDVAMYSYHEIPNDKESRKQLKINLK